MTSSTSTTITPLSEYGKLEFELRRRQRAGRRRHTKKQEQQTNFDTLGLVRCEKCGRRVTEFEVTTIVTPTGGEHKTCDNCYGKSDASGRLWYNNA